MCRGCGMRWARGARPSPSGSTSSATGGRSASFRPRPPRQGRASITERVYKFRDGRQISVFPSAPTAAGAPPDASYSPLWRLVLVAWKPGASVRELRSEEAVLAAAEAGELSLDVTDIVVNCPIVPGARR